MDKQTTSAQIYVGDSLLLKDFMKRKGIENMRDALRIAVEFTNAHGGFS